MDDGILRIHNQLYYFLFVLIIINQASKRITTNQLCERTGISTSFIEQITSRLLKARLINSKKGPGGGYDLAIKPKDIMFDTIINVAETKRGYPSALAKEYQQLSHVIEKRFAGMTLQTFLDEMEIS